jgi:hypothetical protein
MVFFVINFSRFKLAKTISPRMFRQKSRLTGQKSRLTGQKWKLKAKTNRTQFDNAARFSLTNNFDPSSSFQNI